MCSQCLGGSVAPKECSCSPPFRATRLQVLPYSLTGLRSHLLVPGPAVTCHLSWVSRFCWVSEANPKLRYFHLGLVPPPWFIDLDPFVYPWLCHRLAYVTTDGDKGAPVTLISSLCYKKPSMQAGGRLFSHSFISSTAAKKSLVPHLTYRTSLTSQNCPPLSQTTRGAPLKWLQKLRRYPCFRPQSQEVAEVRHGPNSDDRSHCAGLLRLL